MYFLALATDYDGTIAHHGVVDAPTLDALRRIRDTGRRLILVTGRELPELIHLLPEAGLFDRIVAENGALVFDPATGEERTLGPPPPRRLLQKLGERGVKPLSVGRVIAATWEPHQTAVLDAIRALGLELQIIFNKGAVMILPPGINKASGLRVALEDLDLSSRNVVAVGDAENDHALLGACGCGVAVANAVPAVKAGADIVLDADHGAGVAELIDQIIARDGDLAPAARHGLLLGTDRKDREIRLAPHRGNLLIVGSSGSGKSTLAKALTEAMVEGQFEFCVLDPEGDYTELRHAACVGGPRTPPAFADVVKLLRDAEANLVLNTQALAFPERRKLFAALVWGTARLRARTGRPHWLVIDEAHQVLPASPEDPPPALAEDGPAAILITIHPASLARSALNSVEAILALGEAPVEELAAFAEATGIAPPQETPEPAPGEILYWAPRSGRPPLAMRPRAPAQAHRRHAGKYADGDVGAHCSFYFRGPRNGMNIPAKNLYQFLDIGFETDDETWEHHLRAGHYSDWFRHVIKDEDLALETERIERDTALDASESRRLIGKAVRRRYAAPAEGY